MCYKYHISFRRCFAFLLGVFALWVGSLSSLAVAGGVSLAWDANTEPDLAGYRVHYGTTSGAYTETLDVGNHIEAEVLNLSANTTYFFAVTAYDTADLESEPSNEVSVTIAPSPPVPPVNLAVVGAAREVTLAWAANSEANLAGYRVYYGTVSGNYPETLDVGNEIGATIPDLTVGSTYYFTVTAYDTAALESEPSSEVMVTIAPPLPITFGGTYSGALVAAADGPSAFAELSVNKSRQFSGRVVIGNFSTAVTGKFNTAGKATVTLLVPLPKPWKFTFQLNPGSGSMDVHLVKGTVDVPLKLTSTPYSSVQLAPQAGSYTVRVGALAPAGVSEAATPGEGGFAVITITPAGRVRTAGRLSDGTAFTSSCYMGANGRFLVHSPIYGKGGGILAGGLAIRETDGVSDGDGVLQWRKPVMPTARFYKQGFDGTVPVLISRFEKISSLQTLNVARSTPARAVLAGGGLPEAPAIERGLAFLSGNSVTVMNTGNERLRLQIRGSNGLITGTFLHPTDGKVRWIAGVLFQKQGAGMGFFPGVQTTGSIQLTGLATPEAQ